MKKLFWLFALLTFTTCARAQFADQRQYASTSAGTVNAQTVAIAQYNLNPGVVVRFKAGLTNTGATTLSINNTAVKAVEVIGPAGLLALTGGEIVSGQTTEVLYDGTQYELLNPAAGAGFAAYFTAPPPLGSVTPNTGSFTTLAASGAVSGAGFSNYLASPPAIGATTPAAGNFTTLGATTQGSGQFTTLAASSTVSGTGFSTYLASPPAIGGSAPAAGSFTTLAASSTVSGTGFSTYLASPPAIGGTAAAAVSTTQLVEKGSAPTGTTGSCVASSFSGGTLAGKFACAVCAAGTVILSALPAAPTGYTCIAQDQTTPADTLKQTANTTTSATFTATCVAADAVVFQCTAW